MALLSVHQQENQVREDEATALNIFVCVVNNENTGRESEAPAERFRPRDHSPLLVGVRRPPDKAPQERRSPVMFDSTMKRCLERWDEAPAERSEAACRALPYLWTSNRGPVKLRGNVALPLLMFLALLFVSDLSFAQTEVPPAPAPQTIPDGLVLLAAIEQIGRAHV